jgi:Ca2+-binding RTX toxin-like protein
MGTAYALYSTTEGVQGDANFTGQEFYNDYGYEYAAFGAFTGATGLPLGLVNSLGDFDTFASALMAKTTEISHVATNFQITYDSAEYIALGSQAGDIVDASDHVTGDGTIWGRHGADSLTGGDGSDVIKGDAGDDVLNGGAGKDHLSGGTGADMLSTSGDGDVLNGGSGADTFVFTDLVSSNAGVITGLTAGDVVDLTAAAQAHGFTEFTAVDHFDHTAGEVTATYKGGHTTFRFDIDGDGHADAKLVIHGGDYHDFSDFHGVDTSGLVV